jgi:hypothetical protein
MCLKFTPSWPVIAVLFVIGIALGVGSASMVHKIFAGWNTPPAPLEVSIPARPSPEVADKKPIKRPIKTRTVKTYPSAVKSELKLPDHVIETPSLDVIASHQVAPDRHPQTVTTVLDTDTGDTQTFVKRDPLPWIARDYHGDIGLYAGIKNGQPTARLQARQGVLQVKALHLGLVGSVDHPMSGSITGTDYFVGAGVWAEW